MAALGGNRDVAGSQNSVEIDSLARFAVEEHNKKQVFIHPILNKFVPLICLFFEKFLSLMLFSY